MKKTIQIIILMIICSILLGSCTSNQTFDKKNITDEASGITGYEYEIRNYNGRVAVFRYKEDEPIEVLDCPLSSLPESEIEKLNNGIYVTDEAELQEFIEAYD